MKKSDFEPNKVKQLQFCEALNYNINEVMYLKDHYTSEKTRFGIHFTTVNYPFNKLNKALQIP